MGRIPFIAAYASTALAAWWAGTSLAGLGIPPAVLVYMAAFAQSADDFALGESLQRTAVTCSFVAPVVLLTLAFLRGRTIGKRRLVLFPLGDIAAVYLLPFLLSTFYVWAALIVPPYVALALDAACIFVGARGARISPIRNQAARRR